MAGVVTPPGTGQLARLLARTRQQELRNGVDHLPSAALWATLVVAVASVAGTVAVGCLRYHVPGAAERVLALVYFLWAAGRVGQAALGQGQGALSPEIFRALPLSRGRLSRALLLVALPDPGLALCAVAFTGLIVTSARSGAGPALAGAVGVVLLTLLVGVSSTVVAGSLAPGSRRGRDLATVVVAATVAVVGAAGAAAPLLESTLTGRHAGALGDLVSWLPSGWAPSAVRAASAGRPGAALGWLVGLAALVAVVVAAWPPLLARRMDARSTPAQRGGGHRHRRLLPATPTGAVVGKELRLWTREQARVLFLLVAVLVGVLVAAIMRVEGEAAGLPFAGALTVVIAAACATNLYGAEGSALGSTSLTPGAARPDVRGRQLAWLLLVEPYAVATTLVLTPASGVPWAWPWVLAMLPALLGGGSRLVVAGSLIAVLPPDDDGNLTPAWSLKVHACLLLAVAVALPPAALLIAGQAGGSDLLRWSAVPVGCLTGAGLAAGLHRLAVSRLLGRQAEVLAAAAPGSVAPGAPSGAAGEPW